MNVDELAAGLAEAGVDAIARDGRGCRGVVDGVAFGVALSHDGLSFRCAVAGEALTLDPEAVNRANLGVRFARYTVEGGNLVVACETPAWQGVASAVRLWQMVLSDLARTVRELVGGPKGETTC